MILPIVAYGDPVLRKVSSEIDKDYPNLKELVANMWETMYNASGVGLAAPQVGLSIRLFLIDSHLIVDELDEKDKEGQIGLKRAFINAEIIEETGDEWSYTEGCLSIPTISEDVVRSEKVRIQYYDENFNFYDETYEGITARVIQHEYDHIEGILFLDYLAPLKKRMLKKKLDKISKGEVSATYRMKFPNFNRRRK